MNETRRPASVWLAGGLTCLAACTLVGIAVASFVAAPDALSAGIAGVLITWGLICGWAGAAMLRGRPLSRGGVVAAGLLHLASCAGFVPSQPWAVVPTVVAATTVAAAVWPTTTAFLRFNEAD